MRPVVNLFCFIPHATNKQADKLRGYHYDPLERLNDG